MTKRAFIVQFVSGQRSPAQSFDGIRDGIRQMSKVVYRRTTDRRRNGTHGFTRVSLNAKLSSADIRIAYEEPAPVNPTFRDLVGGPMLRECASLLSEAPRL